MGVRTPLNITTSLCSFISVSSRECRLSRVFQPGARERASAECSASSKPSTTFSVAEIDYYSINAG
jgi:hypothetical protein